jgi:uncharacterized repeat protein (TIGR03803 family)
MVITFPERRWMMKRLISLAIVLAFFVVFLSGGMAQTGYTILHTFSGQTAGDGAVPRGGLVSDGSSLYGTTMYGGSDYYGTVFAVNPDGSGYSVLRDFSPQSDGATGPVGSLVSDGRTLYGTASYYGPNHFGTVFSLETDGSGYIDIHAFAESTDDGRLPSSGLINDGSRLYGTTSLGGSVGLGTVFSLDFNGSSSMVLHSFPEFPGDGFQPYANVMAEAGSLYGTTLMSTSSDPFTFTGVLYSMSTDGGEYTILHHFGRQTDDGFSSIGGLVSDSTRLYGTTGYGGINYYGTIFSVNTDGSDYTIIHSFAAFTGDGEFPVASLLSNGSRLYGTTTYGGATGYYGGVIFSLNNDGSAYTILHDFGVQTGDGNSPWCILLLENNTLYGTTQYGGEFDYGVVFSYALPSPTPSPAPTPEYMVISLGDYTGDGESDLAIFRPASGLWAVRGLGRVYFGGAGDIPVSGDYNGDGYADVSIFRPSSGLWAIKEVTRVYFGTPDQMPVPGDYNGNGSCDISVFDKITGLWAVRDLTRVYFGAADDMPVPADYTGDGVTDPGIFRSASGLWAIRGVTRAYFGASGDTPVPGDYIWYGAQAQWAAEIAVFRGSTGLWAIRNGARSYFGGAGDIPVSGNFTGNAFDQTGIFRPESGLWAIKGITRAYFGGGGDIPVTR